MERNLVVVGIIGPARGLKGEVALDIRTDSPEERLAPGTVVSTTSDEFPELTLERLSYLKGRAYVFFHEINTREEAEAIRGVSLTAEELLEDDAWYPRELVGLAAVDPGGNELGRVLNLEIGGAQDQLVIDHQGRSVRVPFVRALVPEVDLEAGRVVIDPPGGLFDEEIDS